MTPLIKVNDYDRKEEGKLPFLCFALEEMIENVNYALYIHDSMKKKKMTVADMENYNARMKNIPILKETMKQGLFLTLDEFKNNFPSVTSFSKRKLRKTNISELVDKNGHTILHYYACYDGITLRIGKPLSSLSKKLSQNYDVMYRVGNSFQFYDDYMINNAIRGTITGDIPDIPYEFNYRSMLIIPRQLDLETGELY
jgi:hypothetical protein